jgi:site-specific DNA recombinase
MRSFIYCRVSTREQGQDDHYSLNNQEQRCRDYVTMKHWHLVKLRKDVASGKSDEREGFQQLLSDVRNKKIDVVLVYRLDRLSRNVRDIYNFLDLIRTHNVAFVSITEGFDTTTAMGRAMLGVAAVFAQLTREMIAENTKDGLLRRAEAGFYRGNLTSLYGYDYSMDKGTLVVNELEAANVRQIFDYYTENKWGQDKIARTLNLRGVPTKSGKSETQWSGSGISDVLKNPVYCGYVRVGSKTLSKSTSINNPASKTNDVALSSDGQARDNFVADTFLSFTPGKHEAIISREQFEQAQSLFSNRARLPVASQQSNHLLSGVACCGLCGRRLRVHYSNGPKGVKSNSSRTYRFYFHGKTVEVGAKECLGLSKSAEQLELAVVAKIAEIAAKGDMERLILQDIKNRTKAETAPIARERDKLLLELDSFSTKFNQWADRLDSGKIDEEQFVEQNKRLLTQKQVAQQRLSVLESELCEQEAVEVTLAEVRKVLSEFPKVWEALEFEEKRETLRLLIEHLKVYKTHLELKLPFLEPMEIPFILQRGRQKSIPVIQI